MQPEMLDRPRQVHHADVLFDSNVLRANDDDAEKRLHALSGLLVAHPDQGNVWFSTMSLAEMLAPKSPEKRIKLLKRFQNLYLRFGERIRFMSSLNDNLRAVCLGRWIPSAPAAVVEEDIAKSIAAGDVVGLLKAGHDDWRSEKQRLRTNYESLTVKNRQSYAERAELRSVFAKVLPSFFSADGLNCCDDIAVRLIADANLWTPLDAVKQRHRDYPCIWTFALLGRLAQYAQTITDEERKQHFPASQDVLEPHPNDFIDADIAGTGARCGMMITNDRGLIAKLNRLYDASLIRLQAFTVSDALVAYNPPNGRVRERPGVAPSWRAMVIDISERRTVLMFPRSGLLLRNARAEEPCESTRRKNVKTGRAALPYHKGSSTTERELCEGSLLEWLSSPSLLRRKPQRAALWAQYSG